MLVQYVLYPAMAMYNPLFLPWVALVLLSFQAFVRLMLARPPADFACQSDSSGARRYVGWFLSRLRPECAKALGLGDRRPDLVVRFGRGKEMPRSLRRPVESVLM